MGLDFSVRGNGGFVTEAAEIGLSKGIPLSWMPFSQKRNKGMVDLKDVLPGVFDTFIWDKLRFPSASDLSERMDVTLDYYDVSSELLYDNDDFKNALQELKESKDPEIDQKSREFSGAFEKAENV